jgi:hypothetical protein
MDGTGNHHVKQNKSDWPKTSITCFLHMWNLDLKKNCTSVKWGGEVIVCGWEPARGKKVKREGEWGNGYDQSTFYTYMKMEKWNTLKVF